MFKRVKNSSGVVSITRILRSKIRTCFIIFLVLSIMIAWDLSGWPMIEGLPFPQGIQEARAAGTRLYFQNAAESFTPTTIRGDWDDDTTSTVVRKLGENKAGASAVAVVTEDTGTEDWDILMVRFVSEPLQYDTSFTSSDTVEWILGVLESASQADFHYHLYIYITQGDTDSLRGALLSDNIASAEWPTKARGYGEGTQSLSTVPAQAGDRIVVEVGYQAQNGRTSNYDGTLYYGATGDDLVQGSTSVTQNSGWIEFSNTFSFANTTTLTNGADPSDYTVDPGDTDNYLDQFTFKTSSGTDSVTALTVTTTNTTAVASMEIWNDAMTTQYFTTVSSPSGDTWDFSGGTPIPVSNSTGTFRVIFTAQTGPPLLGGAYPVTGMVTDFTCSNDKSGTDFHSITVTVLNPITVSFTIIDNGDTGMDFGDLDNPATDQPEVAQNGTTGAVTLQVGSDTNIAIHVQIKGESLSDGSGHTISLDNIKYNDSNTVSGAVTLTGSYTTWYSVPAYTADTVQCYHWIAIPGGQTGGDYTSIFYYQAVPQ